MHKANGKLSKALSRVFKVEVKAMRIKMLLVLIILMLIGIDGIKANTTQASKTRKKEAPQKFDEYSDIPFEQEKQYLDYLAVQLKRDSDLTSYIIVYAGQRAHPNEGQEHANKLFSYLFDEHDIDERQIRTIDGGFRERPAVEIFLISRRTTTPKASPTIAPGDVEFIVDDNHIPAIPIFKKANELLALTLSKVEPKYPPLAKAARVRGEVGVRVVIDEEGLVVSVRTMFGHPLLREAAEMAARQWRFTRVNGGAETGKIAGLLIFTFDLAEEQKD